jgi:hypothetical protein
MRSAASTVIGGSAGNLGVLDTASKRTLAAR